MVVQRCDMLSKEKLKFKIITIWLYLCVHLYKLIQ